MSGTYRRRSKLSLKLHIMWGEFVNKHVTAWKKTVVKSILSSSGQLGCLGSSPSASLAWLVLSSNAPFPVFEKLTGDYLQISSKVFFHRLSLDVSFRFLKVRCHLFTDFFVSAIPTIFEHLLYVRHLFPPGTEDIAAIKIGKISASKTELLVVERNRH